MEEDDQYDNIKSQSRSSTGNLSRPRMGSVLARVISTATPVVATEKDCETKKEKKEKNKNKPTTTGVAEVPMPSGTVCEAESSPTNDSLEKQDKKEKENKKLQSSWVSTDDEDSPARASTRVYAYSLCEGISMAGMVKSESESVLYRINVRGGSGYLTDSSVANRLKRIGQEIKFNEILAQTFCKAAQKYSAFTADHSAADLAGLIEQLSAGMAHYANFGTLKFKELSGGVTPLVHSLAYYSARAIPTTNCIFVPHSIDTNISPGTFAAIVAAGAARGSTIITDMVSVDANSNTALIQEFNDAALALGCYDALTIIGKMYETSGGADIFAVALTRGVHRMCSVVGHTDEGAWFRRLLRTNTYAVPYGGISKSDGTLVSIPCPANLDIASFRRLVDGILLYTAALVAECEPGVEINGELYPTVTSTKSCDGSEHLNMIAVRMSEFTSLYLRGLMHLFELTNSSNMARHVIQMPVSSQYLGKDRHLQMEVVAPFYWVEPSGIIRDAIPGVSKRSPLFGALFYEGEGAVNRTIGDDCTLVDEYNGSYIVSLRYRSLRSNPLLRWLATRELDGLGFINVVRCDAAMFVLPGGGVNVRELASIAEGEEDVSLHRFAWLKGDNPLPRPAEALYMGDHIEIEIHWSYTEKGSGKYRAWSQRLTGLPSVSQLATFSCDMEATRLCHDIDSGDYNPSSKANRTSTIGASRIMRRIMNEGRGAIAGSKQRFSGTGESTSLIGKRLIASSSLRGARGESASVRQHATDEDGVLGHGANIGRQPYVPEPSRVPRPTGPAQMQTTSTATPIAEVEGMQPERGEGGDNPSPEFI